MVPLLPPHPATAVAFSNPPSKAPALEASQATRLEDDEADAQTRLLAIDLIGVVTYYDILGFFLIFRRY